jgi:hypothetical protein
MRSIIFVACLFIVGLCALVVGGIDLYGLAEFHWSSRQANMVLADPSHASNQPSPYDNFQVVNVRYVQSDGNSIAISRFVPANVAQQLNNGASVPITYLVNKPERVFYAGEEPESPWIWLVVGIASMFTFVYAWRLIKRERRPS